MVLSKQKLNIHTYMYTWEYFWEFMDFLCCFQCCSVALQTVFTNSIIYPKTWYVFSGHWLKNTKSDYSFKFCLKKLKKKPTNFKAKITPAKSVVRLFFRKHLNLNNFSVYSKSQQQHSLCSTKRNNNIKSLFT